MQISEIQYNDQEQTLHGMLYIPDHPKAGVVVYPAFEGRSKFALDYAKKIATQGYATLCADIYGDAKTANTIEGCFELITPFLADRALVRRRACLALDTLCAQVNVEKTATLGFCFGGTCALEVMRAGKMPTVTIGLHAALAQSDLPTTTSIKSKILILHGYQDVQVPPENLQQFAEEMHTAGVDDWTFTFFGDGKHSFTDPLTGTFNPDKEKEMGREYNSVIADRSYRYTIDFLQEWL